MSYDWLDYLDIKSEKDGWFKFKWQPVLHRHSRDGTWNVYTTKTYYNFRRLGMWLSKTGGYNGWWKRLDIRISLWWVEIEAWIHYDFTAMEMGPADSDHPMDTEKIRKFREKTA